MTPRRSSAVGFPLPPNIRIRLLAGVPGKVLAQASLRVRAKPCRRAGPERARPSHHPDQPILKLEACSEDGATPFMSIEPSLPSDSKLPPDPSLVRAANACALVV